MTPRVNGSLAWKLLGIGILQLVLLAAVFMGVGWLVNGPPPGLTGPPNGVGPPPFPPSDDVRPGPPPGAPPGPPPHPANGPPHHPAERRPTLTTPLTTLFVGGLVILGIGSLLTARSIVRPLRQLSRAVQMLGEGHLHARSGLDRSDEIGALARTFDEMAQRLERLVLAEKELLANVSHELRTPLARIRVALDISNEKDDGASRGSLSEIELDLAEIETMIDDILTTTRLEIAGGGATREAHLELHLEETTAAALCAWAATRFRSAHPERPLIVEMSERKLAIHADRVLFRRA